jgi:hypothetical protein
MNEYILILYDLCYLQGREVTQLVEAPRHKTGGLGFDFRQDLCENFRVIQSVCPHSVALGSTQLLTEMSTNEYPWG